MAEAQINGVTDEQSVDRIIGLRLNGKNNRRIDHTKWLLRPLPRQVSHVH